MSNELDRQIGEKLNNYASDVDAEALWQAVRPPRRRWPWVLLALLIGCATIGAAYWWSSVKHAPVEMAEQSQAEAPHATALATKEAPQEVGQSPAKEKLDASTNPPVVTAESLNATTFSSNSIGKNIDVKILKDNILSNEKNVENIVGNDEVGIAKEPQLAETKRSNTNFRRSFETTTTQDKAVAGNSSLDVSGQAASAEGMEAVVEAPINTQLTAVPYLPTLSFSVSRANKLNIGAEARMEAVVENPPTRTKQQWFVQADAAYLLPQRTLEAGENAEPSWAAERTERETVLESISADLSVGKRWANGWQLRSGLGYTRINTRFDDSFTTESIDSVEGLQMLVFGPGNTVDSIFGPVAFYETTVREKQTYNSITQWEVPLLAGYQLELGSLSLLLEGGVRLQLRRSWEGETRYGAEGLQDLAAQYWYRSGLAVSLQGGVLLAYPLSDHLAVLAGGSLRYSLQDFSTTTSPFREKYQLLGGQLGLRYEF